jgi:hypothetical protein
MNLPRSLWWQGHLDWFPFQPCLACGKWFWGGLPRKGWRAAFMTYCSKASHEACE